MDVGRKKTQKWPLSSLPVSPLGQCGSGPTLPCLPSCLLLETAIKIPKTALAAAHFNFPNLHNLCLISVNHKRRLFARKFCGAPSSLFMRALQGRLIKTGANLGASLRWTHRRNDTQEEELTLFTFDIRPPPPSSRIFAQRTVLLRKKRYLSLMHFFSKYMYWGNLGCRVGTHL